MRRIKRWFVAMLIMVQVLNLYTFNVDAAGKTNGEVEVILITNQKEYNEGEEIEVFLEIINRGKEDISNVNIDITVPDPYVVSKDNEFETKVSTISGESNIKLSSRYVAMVTGDKPQETTKPQEPTITALPDTSIGDKENIENTTNIGSVDGSTVKSPKTNDGSKNMMIVAFLTLLLGVAGVYVLIRSKKGRKYFSLFLCGIVLFNSINVLEVLATEDNVNRENVVVTEIISIAGEERSVSATVTYDVRTESVYFNFSVDSLDADNYIVTKANVIDLSGIVDSNSIVSLIKCVVYSDVDDENKEYVVQGTQNWFVDDVELNAGNNYITLVAYDENGNSGTFNIKVIKDVETTGTITVDNVNEYNCVEVLGDALEITGVATSNKKISSINCVFNSAANEEIRSVKAEGASSWKFADLPLDIGTNYLTITATCIDGSQFSTDVNVVRYSTEIELADNVIAINPNTEEDYLEIQSIYHQIIDVWTEDFGTEDTTDDELNIAMYETNPLYQSVLSGELQKGNVIYIPQNEFFLTGLTVKYLYTDDNYVGDVEGYEPSNCQVMHVKMAGFADLFDNSQDIAISAIEINRENPVAFVYFPYAIEAENAYAMQTMALVGDSDDEPSNAKESNDKDVVDGRKFQYQNISPDKIKVTFESEALSKCGLKVELGEGDELVIFDFDGKASTKNDRLSLSGEINLEDINAVVGFELHPELLALESKLIPKQIIARLDYTKKNELKVSYGGSVELEKLIEQLKLGFDNKAEVKLFGQDVELEGVDTSGRIYLASIGINLKTMTGCYIKDLDDTVEPLVVINLYETLGGTIEAEAYLSIETEAYCKNGFNFQKTDFEGNLGGIEDNKGSTNIPITIPSLSSNGSSEYELNIYDIEGKSKEEPYENPEWIVKAGIEGKTTLNSGLGIGVGAMICGIMPASLDASICVENALIGEGSAKLGNYGDEKNYLFDFLGEQIYGTLEGKYDFFSRLALTAKPDFKLSICVDEILVADVVLPKMPEANITLFESGFSSKKIEGIVYDSITKLPVSGAKVILGKQNSLGEKYEVVTDGKGYFVISDILVIDDVNFDLEIIKADYETIRLEVLEEDLDGDVTEHYMVCTLEYPYVKGTVSVVTEDGGVGETLYFATVTYEGIAGTETEGINKSCQTNVKGVFDIGYMPEGTYNVSVSRVGYKTQTMTVVLARGEAGEADFVLESEEVQLSGYVYYESTEGEMIFIEGASVELLRTVGSVNESYSVKTDNNGYYELAGVLASNGEEDESGSYSLNVNAIGFAKYDDSIKIDTDIQKDVKLGIEVVSLQDCEVTLSQSNYTYDGMEKKPAVTVTYDDETVDESNYTVSYKNNVVAGNAQVIVTANPDSILFEGSITVDFVIEALPVEISEIVFSGNTSAAIAENGDLYMWGRNDYGQVGDGTTENRSKAVKVLENVTNVSISNLISAAITEDGSLYAWGYLSLGSVEENAYIGKEPVKMLNDVQEVVCGGAHLAAIANDGSLYVMGANSWGQIGDDTTAHKYAPVKVLDNVVKVDCTSVYNVGALTEDGILYIWGHNKYGQIGNGTTVDSHTPIKVLEGVQDFWMSQYVSLALMEDGSLYMWGYDIGSVPQMVLENVKTVSRGNVFTGAITEDGSLYMWGQDSYGQLGDGSISKSEESTPVKVLDNVVELMCYQYYYTTAITEDGSLYIWGNNEGGKMGNGTEENVCVPFKVLDNVQEVTGGDYHVAATLKSGEIYIWGGNAYGQLGDGSVENCYTPKLLEVYNDGLY